MLNIISNKVVPSLKDVPIYGETFDSRVTETKGRSTNYDYMNQNYARRIEPNKTWTICHVFTGIPINISNRLMIGLSETEATTAMIVLNVRNAKNAKTQDWNQSLSHGLVGFRALYHGIKFSEPEPLL